LKWKSKRLAIFVAEKGNKRENPCLFLEHSKVFLLLLLHEVNSLLCFGQTTVVFCCNAELSADLLDCILG